MFSASELPLADSLQSYYLLKDTRATATILLVLLNFYISFKQQTLTRWYRSKLIICLLTYKTGVSPLLDPALFPPSSPILTSCLQLSRQTHTGRPSVILMELMPTVWPSCFVKMIPMYLFSELLTSGHNKIMVIVFFFLGSRLFISAGCSLTR